MNRLWFLFIIICLAFVFHAGAAEYYVSPRGNDTTGDGSHDRPWRTIQKAANTMSSGNTCHVMDGEYYEMVRPARSGAAGQYISFVADGQSVILNGTRRITGWTVHNGSIWKANASWDFGELFVDRQRMVLARWPNLTSGDIYHPNFYQATANGGDTSIIDSVHLTQPSGYWSGAKIFMVPGLGWTADQRDVSSYDPANHQISFNTAISFSNSYDVDQSSLYFLYDMLSLLDVQSEWFLDRTADKVYLWLPGGGDPNGHIVEASGGAGGFDLTDRSYIRVAGFKLMGCDIKMPDATGCKVEEVQHLYPASELLVSGEDNEITRSEIAYASYTGVRLNGTRNTLSKCNVHHCDYYGTENSIVEIGGSQNSVVDCSLHDAGGSGVSIIPGTDISRGMIDHNEIYNVGFIIKDCGLFYSYETKGGGTEIKYNIFHDIWPRETPQYEESLGNGIYLDKESSDFSVHHNTVFRTAGYAIMMQQPSRKNLAYNNTFVGSGGGTASVIGSEPTGNLFGVDGTVVANNLAVILDDRLGWCINFVSKVPAYHHNGYYQPPDNDRLNNLGVENTGIIGNPLFTDAAGFDFSLLSGSPMIDMGAVIPGITDGYAGSAPDIGAYERGGSELPGPRYKPGTSPVGIGSPDAPSVFRLEQNFPNPFNSVTLIEFYVPHSEFVILKVFNILGEEVAILMESGVTSGSHKIAWDASGFASGLYFYRLEAGSTVLTKKLLLLK
jgi:hypothetical protein